MATEEKKPAEAEKSAKDDAPEAAAETSGKRRKLIMIGGGAVLVLGIGGGAAFFLTKNPSATSTPATEAAATTDANGDEEHAAAAPAKEKSKDGHGEEKAKEHGATAKEEAKGGEAHAAKVVEGIQFGATMPFKTFHLNLGNPLENHYLRLEIAVEYKGGDGQKTEIDMRMPQLRDAVVSVASRKSREFLLGPDGKEQLRRELLIRLNRYMSKPIEAVYITDMLIE